MSLFPSGGGVHYGHIKRLHLIIPIKSVKKRCNMIKGSLGCFYNRGNFGFYNTDDLFLLLSLYNWTVRFLQL